MLDTAAEIEYLRVRAVPIMYSWMISSLLQEAIQRLGYQREDGKIACSYGKLMKDDQVSNTRK